MEEIVLRSSRRRGLATATALLAVTAIATPAYSSDVTHPVVVSDNPADFTPRVLASPAVTQPTVLALAE